MMSNASAQKRVGSVKVLGAAVEFVEQPLKKPLQLSKGTITRVSEARATVRVSVGGTEFVGRSNIYLSDLWSWPDHSLTHDQRDAVMRRYAQAISDELPDRCGAAGHPIELGLRLHRSVCDEAAPQCESRYGLALPQLSRIVCASPFDAAIHDAAGRAEGVSAFHIYGNGTRLPSADALFEGSDAAAAIRDVIATSPKRALDGWLVVAASDSMDVDVKPWIVDRGFRCFKLKLLGKDTAADVTRTIEVYRKAKEFGLASARLSADSNEGNPDAASVGDYLRALRDADGSAYDALEYLEQPTPRDISRHTNDWHEVASMKGVVLDEGLSDIAQMADALSQGWSGLALKTCKGQTFCLLAAAWLKRHGRMMVLQDLTNPGYSAIHSALFGAWVPNQNGIELNACQYTPDANAPWLPRLAKLMDPRDGKHWIDVPGAAGLGSDL